MESWNFFHEQAVFTTCHDKDARENVNNMEDYGRIRNGLSRRLTEHFSWIKLRSIITICIVLLPILTAAHPVPSPSTCGVVECKAATEDARNFKFHYKAGSFYNYLYVVNGTVFVDGSTGKERSGIHFSANATIQFLTECDALLHMKDVELWQSVFPSGQDDIHKHHFTEARTTKTFKKSLEQFPLRFSYADGLISELCPDKEEAGWVLNLKRGLLSGFMNSMRRLDLEHKSEEDDVNGNCKVEYRLGQATSSTLTIQRIKNLNTCGDKFGIFSSIQGAPYSFGKQSMPAIESLSECNQVVDRNLIVEVQCLERHRLKPLSSGTSGVQVTINQHLDLVNVYTTRNGTDDDSSLDKDNDEFDDGFGLGDDEEDEENDTNKPEKSFLENAGSFFIIYKPDPYISEIINVSHGEIGRRESLHFQHQYHASSSTTNEYNTARNALLKFCQAVKANVEGNAGAAFETLVQILRGVSSTDMMHLSRESSSLCDGDRSLFDDVLEAVGSAASVGVIKDRIFSEDAPRETISSWINSLTFIPKPDLDLMGAAYPILSKRVRDNYPNILLSYSALAHSFCRQHPHCSQYQPVQILGKLYEKFFNLTGCVTKQHKNVEQVLIYLKGIGNFGMFTPGIHFALQTCIKNNDKSEIRVAAIEAYRRIPCAEVQEGHSDLREVFADQNVDSEVRIAAFLTIMRCATYPTIRWLKNVMEKEEVRQVTSFVSSFMRNLQETSLPSKLELQGLVADEKFNDPFHTDFRQFSKNLEASAFYSEGNFGMALESNLVFSQDSYLPRSTSLNLTMDLFGESVNVLEATVRLESFEHYVESIFGPNGKLKGTRLHNLLSSLRRQKRAVPSKRKMRTLAVEYDAMRRYYNDPIVSVSLKTLGNEIAFLRKVGLEEQVKSLSKLNPLLFLEKLTNTKDSNWQKSTILFDSSYIIPTGVGLPLNLSAQASSIMRFQAESMIDATNFRANPFQLKLKGKLVPSALVTASATVSLSAFKSHAGMKVRGQVRSSTALEGGFEMKGSKLLDVELGIPTSQIELLQFKSEVLFMKQDEFHGAGDKSLILKETCDAGLLYKYMGLKICSRYNFPLPLDENNDLDDDDHKPTLMSSLPFLIKGPAHYSLTVDKSNSNLLKTRFHYQWDNNETSTNFILRTVRTLGSIGNWKEDKFGIIYDLDKVNRKFNLDVHVPGSDANINGQLKEEKSVLNLEAKDKSSQSPYMRVALQLDGVQLAGSGEEQVKGSRKYTGLGEIFYKNWKMELLMDGSLDQRKVDGNCKGSYQTGSGMSEWISISFSRSNEEKRRFSHVLALSTETQLTFESSQYPDYNSGAVWKSKISEDGYQNDIDFRQGRNHFRENDPTTFRIQGGAHHESNHEKTKLKWIFLVTQPSQETDWGVEASFHSQGKSFDSAISFRYAPDKAYGTRFSLKRKPGVMLFLDAGWNVTVPDSPPMQLLLYINEQAARIYQVHYKMDWFGGNRLALDIELSDRSRRNKQDTSCTLMVSTRTIDNFKIGLHYLSEEKETKLQLSSEYQNRRNAFEAGHILSGAKKHKLYGSVTTGEVVYLIMSELDFEHGVQSSLRTDFGPTFSNVDVRVKVTNQNGLRTLQLDYSWDVLRDIGKRFLFEVSLDSSKPYFHRVEGIVIFPGYNYYCEGHYRYDGDDRSRIVMGRLKWKDEEHLHVNAQLVPRISDHEAYDVRLEVATPFELVKNVSFNTGIEFLKERKQCLMNIEGSWGDTERLEASIESLIENLGADGESNEENNGGTEVRIPFRYNLQANITSTIEGLTNLKVNLHHTQFGRLNCKSDLDIQLANEKEISVTNHLVLPSSFFDLLSTRIELHVKTPFAGYQNLDLQAILGRKEDKDVMALIGIYIENFQYSIAIGGTPRFEEDGAVGFELTTSNPKYDKIFGSFSYVIGDNSRLACQLGWPQVVVGLEAGVESSGWEEFQVYLTFTSPWMPVKNINALAKIDRAQFAEIKLELNEDGINGKSEWVIESWTSFDMRLEGSTPFTGARTFGGVLKHSWDNPTTYHSQILGWLDTLQAGYKLEGGTSEKEEECGFVKVRHAQLEVDTVVYPTVRTTLNLSQMDIKYNLDVSILLREGPINVMAELEVLDVLRFNEKVLITTPYPGLFELEINLNPAIVREQNLYNLGVHSKWRSGSKWDEAGLVIRYGSQEEYVALVTKDMDDAAFLQCGSTEDLQDTEGDDDYTRADTGLGSPSTVNLPRSQLFHFYSPLKWGNVVKLEYELVSGSPDSDGDGESQAQDQHSQDGDILVDQFPLRNFALLYRAANATLSTTLQNEAALRTFAAVIDTASMLEQRVAYELDCSLDMTEVERRLSVRAMSHHPSQREYSLMSQWNNQLPQYFNGNLELSTPIDKLEQQTASLMYAHNEGELYTIDLELMSITFDKFATNVVLGPKHFSMTLNTPIENYQEMDIRADSKYSDDTGDESVIETLIVLKKGEGTEIEIDLKSTMEDQRTHSVKGTISATFAHNTYPQGNLEGSVVKDSQTNLTSEGNVRWDNGKNAKAQLELYLPHNETIVLPSFKIMAETNFENMESWEIQMISLGGDNNYDIKAKLPFQAFADCSGVFLVEKGNSWLEVKALKMQGETPIVSFSAESSWLLEKWNEFEVAAKGKYNARLDENLRSTHKFLETLPNSNSFALSIANKIPTLSVLTSLDSKVKIKVEEPDLRAGQHLQISYKANESPTFTLESSTVSLDDFTLVNMTADFDNELDMFDGSAIYKSSGSRDRIYEIDCEWAKNEEGIDGKGEFIWGSEALGTVSIQSTFNCSVNSEGSERMVHVLVGSALPKPVLGTQETEQQKGQEVEEVRTSVANPLDNPMLTIDGTFNKISGRHSARVQLGQDGLEEPPMVTNLQIYFEDLKNFETITHFTSNIENFTDIKLHLGHNIDGNVLNGSYGGHWNGDEGMVKYFAEYENSENLLLFNVSLYGVIPISTESVPKPQRAGVDVFYRGEIQNTETAFRGEYNGVQLLKTDYKSRSLSSAGLDTENTQLELDNHFWPFGFNHTYQYTYSGGYQGSNYPTKLAHYLDLYSLHDSTQRKFLGEFQLVTNSSGQQISLRGTHPSRVMHLITDYNGLNGQFHHSTNLSWKSESWLGYELSLMNMTNELETDHRLSLKATYPIRTIHLDSGYIISGNTFKWSTDLNLNASRTQDKINSEVVCSIEPNRKENKISGKMEVKVKHPLLVHDMIAAGELTMLGVTGSSGSPSGGGRIDGIFSMEYSDDPRERLILNWDGKVDLHEIVYGSVASSYITLLLPTSIPYWEVETNGKLKHLATNLDLKAMCSSQNSPHELSIITLMDFKNSRKNEKLESKMDFKLLKLAKQLLFQMSDPEGYALFSGQLSGQYPYYVGNGIWNVSGIVPNPEAKVSLDLLKPYLKMYAVHGEDGLFSEGGVIDSRNVYFDISESYDGYRYSDVNFYMRLNHSRLVTSRLKWRPELYYEVKDSIIKLYRNATEVAGAKWDRMMKAVKEDGTHSINDIWDTMKPNVAKFLDALEKDANFSADAEALQTYLVGMYNSNELHLQDIHDYVQLVAEEISAKLKSAFERSKRELENPARMLEKALAWIADHLQKIYTNIYTAWQNYLSSGGQGLKASLDKLKQLFYLYLNDGIEMAEQLIIQVYQNLSNFASDIYSHISRVVDEYQPIVMRYLHQIEATVYNIISKFMDFFYETRDAVMKSPYYQKLTKLAEDMDQIYKDIRRNDMQTNFRKYFGMLTRFITRKIAELKSLNLSLGRVGKWLDAAIKSAMNIEAVQDILKAFYSAVDSVKYIAEYTEMDVLVPDFILTMISKGYSIFFMTAIDTASKFEQAKTKFYFDPSKGLVQLEQKLPMPLAAFNETPSFEELPEYKAVTKAQQFFHTSNESYKSMYNKILLNPQNVIPPYQGRAMLVGSQYYFTFDGRFYKHSANCVHLLAGDLVDGNFSLSIQHDTEEGKSRYSIIVASGHNTLIIDTAEGIKDPKRGLKQTVSLPVQMANLQGYQEANMLVVESLKGLRVSCDTMHNICQVEISGWYSRKVAGTLGTMDLEPSTDLILANGERTKDIAEVFKSWDVSDNGACTEQNLDAKQDLDSSTSTHSTSDLTTSACHRIFQSKQSSLQSCFPHINVDPYLEMCLEQEEDPSATSPSYCVSAIGYMYQCQGLGIRVKAPSGCVKCMIGDEIMTEGDMKVISSPPAGSPTVLSTDIVFIIEAKDCNRALRTRRKIDTIVAALEEEFSKNDFRNNRYAAVVYGGDGVFDSPRPIVQNREIFTTSENISGFVTSASMGNGNNDTFQAIRFTLENLVFRPGVSKTIILIPCSNCNPWEMTVDFPTIHYAMLEQDAKLHVLMNKDFYFDTKNLAKKFFGYDAKLGYTKSDGIKNRFKGDPKIRHQVFLPRNNLGYCAPLALETNGTIFSIKKLQNRREKVVQLFTTVFSRRVVAKAIPSECQTCYCLPNEKTGLGKVDCFVCSYPRYKPFPDDYDDNAVSVDKETQNQFEDEETDAYDDDTVIDEEED